MTPPQRSLRFSHKVLAVIEAILLAALMAEAPAATAGQKVVVQKLVATEGAAPAVVPLPVAAIQGLGASVVEDYEVMAVVDLGETTAAALTQATGLAVSPLPDHDKVFLRGWTLAAQGGLPDGVIAPAFPPDHANLYLVVLRSIPKAEWTAALGAAGAQIIGYIPANTYLVYGRLNDLRNLQASHTYLINVLPFVPQFKFLDQPRLLASDGYSKALVQVLNVPSGDAVIAEIQAVALPGTFNQVSMGDVTAVLGELPIDTVQSLAYSPEVLSIEPAPQLTPSGERDALNVAGQLVAASEIDPDTGQLRTVYKPDQTVDYYSWLSQKGLANATDIYLGLLDTGLDLGLTTNVHIDFKDTQAPPQSRVQYQLNPAGAPDASDCYAHGTLVAAVMAGSGGTTSGTSFSESATSSSPCSGCTGSCPNPSSCTSGLFWADAGIAPAAKIASAKIYDETGGDGPPGGGQEWTVVIPRVQNGLANLAGYGVWAANLSSNDPYFTSYTTFSQALDRRVRDASGIGLQIPISIVVSSGNQGGLVESPATAKNVISVGASEGYNPFLDPTACIGFSDANNAYDVAYFSAAGTASPDNRFKPDLVAPGTRVMGALTRSAPSSCWSHKSCGRNHPGGGDDGTLPGMGGANPITWDAGTSFSAPAVTGAAGLVSKWYKNVHAGARPSPAMTKAMLINSASDIQGGKHKVGTTVYTIPHIPSSTDQGWGKLDLRRAFPSQGNYFDLDQTWLFPSSGANTYLRSFTVRDPSKPVRVTVVWTDKEAAVGAGVTLVNDVNVVVGNLMWSSFFVGNSFDPTTGRSYMYPAGQPLPYDHRNNVEEIVFLPSQYGLSGFYIQVWAQTIASPPIQGGQDFALFVENAY
jgi:hypothetical protein